MTTTLTPEQRQAVADRVSLDTTPHLARGLGTTEEPCSVAAINLALTGTLTDDVPDCMSPAIGRWIIAIQDRMPAAIRDSAQWRALLPEAAGTGRDHEDAVAQVAFDHKWRVLALVPAGPGWDAEWKRMLEERTAEAVYAANAAVTNAACAAHATAYAVAATSAPHAASAVVNAADAGASWDDIDPCRILRDLIDAARGESRA